MDFRDTAAKASSAIIEKHAPTPWYEIGESLCLPVRSCNYFFLYLSELSTIFISTGCIIWVVLCLVYIEEGLISTEFDLISMFVILFLLLFLRKFQAQFIYLLLKLTKGNIISDFHDLPSVFISLEESRTVKKIKICGEDFGICFLDSSRRRIIIDGCAYRYIIQAEDVISIKPVSTYAIGGSILKCKIAGQEMGIALTRANEGPFLTLILTFIPFYAAKSLSSLLIASWFNQVATSYQKDNALKEPQVQFNHIWIDTEQGPPAADQKKDS